MRAFAVAVFSSLITWTTGALGEPGPAPTREHRLAWNYPDFRPSEYVLSSAATVGTLVLNFGWKRIPQSDWRDGILFDDAARDRMRLSTPEGRDRAAKVSDFVWYGTQFYPVVDSLIVPLLFDRGNTRVSLQMLL